MTLKNYILESIYQKLNESSFQKIMIESYEELPKRDGMPKEHKVSLDHIHGWEPDENKSRDTIEHFKRMYKKYKETGDHSHLPNPITLEPNTGKLKTRSGKILDTGKKKHLVWDGHHRLIAAKEAGLDHINARITTDKSIGQQ